MKENPLTQKDISRRQFFRRTWLVGTGMVGAYALDQAPRAIVESSVPYLRKPSHSEILFAKEQEIRLKTSDSVSLVFGGATVRDAHELTVAVTPALEALGPVGSLRYAHSSLDTGSIAEGINALGKSELSIYGQSLGALVFGAVLPKIDPQIRIKHLFLDNTPPSFASLDHPNLARAIESSPWDASSLVAGIANLSTYGTLFEEGTAPPGLLWDQLELQKDGEKYLNLLAERVRRDRTAVTFLCPKDPTVDPTVNTQAAESRLYDFFPSMRVYRLGGKQGHANPSENSHEYDRALTHAVKQT